MEQKVWSVTINGQNDCVVMTETEAAMVTLKFSGEQFEIYDMTKRHGMKPEYLHKMSRMTDAEYWSGSSVTVLKETEHTKGIGPGAFGGAARVVWEFEDLMEM